MALRLSFTFIAFGLLVPAVAVHAQNRQVTVIGSVVDSVNNRPLDKVDVYLPDDAATKTNGEGIFRLRFVPGETTLLLFRRIGYSPRAIRLNLQGREGQVELGTIQLKDVTYALDTLVVETRMMTRNPRLADFYRRKRQGQGTYITRQDILKRNPMVATDLVRMVPGLTVGCMSLGECVPASFRKTAAGEVTCPMRVLLDGLPSSVELDMIPPAWIAGMEIYKSLTFTPLELGSLGTVGQGNPGCGTLVIWTGADDYGP